MKIFVPPQSGGMEIRMKIGIITINDNMNYGNRLQNYAVIKIFSHLGADVTNIVIKNRDDYLEKSNSKVTASIKRCFKIFPYKVMMLIIDTKRKVSLNKLERMREKKFCSFNKRYIANHYCFVKKYEKIQFTEYDYFIVGSDQVWNPYFAGDEKYFLTFAHPEKRIAFAASIGVSELPEEEKERYKTNLNSMHYISVREKAAANIIYELIGKKVDCFLDPVFLLSREEWEKIIETVQELPKKYSLKIFLGEEPKGIKEFSENEGYSVITMNNINFPQYFDLNPAQLLYLIKNAEVIYTDSFHITAFSIIFEKQFYVFKRKSDMKDMFSRMENLLERMNLMDRIQMENEMKKKDKITEDKFSNIKELLYQERKRVGDILTNVLQQ